MFTGEEVERIVCGKPEVDIGLLEVGVYRIFWFDTIQWVAEYMMTTLCTFNVNLY